MGIRVGIPILKLSKNGKSTNRKGNAKKIALEGLSERYSKDKDLDKTKSKNNIYFGFDSGEKLYNYWEENANNHRDKLGRKLRADAVIGYTLIIKPDMEGMENIKNKDLFLKDSIEVITDILNNHDLVVDAAAIHKDEVNEHVHLFGHDNEYKAGKKINLSLYTDFNKEYPKRMREKGYDVEDMSVYDVDKVKDMSEDEKQEYKNELIKRKKNKKKNGRSSNKYKEDLLEQEKKQIEEAKEKIRSDYDDYIVDCFNLGQRKNELNQRENELDKVNESLKKSELDLDNYRNKLNRYKIDLERRESDLKEKINVERLKVSEANKKALEREREAQRVISEAKAIRPMLESLKKDVEKIKNDDLKSKIRELESLYTDIDEYSQDDYTF